MGVVKKKYSQKRGKIMEFSYKKYWNNKKRLNPAAFFKTKMLAFNAYFDCVISLTIRHPDLVLIYRIYFTVDQSCSYLCFNAPVRH